ncbi:hypothetical protein JCM4814A_70310 [Streptomyces phaeofaciens JCM 4814]|uniref:RDD family protein n=1 Tax=Streptomyces phaeofaciens TaxID=68254 RepID=A0A918LSC1_9ACTN|nr:RDD family protein [Streptomyces phaeofaciens]GGT42472.1 hypothetical protein GCM10010226_18950 [Streptomyces phaeofaciens]
MSAPTPAPGDDRPREGFYPDPSIPGYVRYWNGSAWVPGTSRPAPSAGEPLTPPAASVEETGPHFFDEDPNTPGRYGGQGEPAAAWGADRSHQSGFGGDQDRRVSWGAPQGPDPRLQAPAQTPPAQPESGAGAGAGDVDSGGTFVFRRPTAQDAPSAAPTAPSGTSAPLPDAGAAAHRAPTPRTPDGPGASGARTGPSGAPGGAGQGPAATGGAAGTGGPAFGPQRAAGEAGGAADAGFGAPGVPGAAPAAARPGFGAGKAAADRAAAAQVAPAPGTAAAQGPAPQAGAAGFPPAAGQAPPAAPGVPQQATGPAPAPAPAAARAAAPMSPGLGGGQSSWAQQVHRLAGGDEPPVPWKPPVDDIFQAAARRQAAARPAGLGKRLAARLVDTVVLAAVTGAAAVPLGLKALDHVNEKIDAAKLTGETVTVWLLDGTTSVYLGIVLAVLLVFGVVYEALPTARWGRTLGKKLLGLEVRDIEGHQPPSFGAALRRWLVYSVPGLLVIGVVGVLWGLFDKPWRQCWHDKAAHTFVAG